MERLWTRPFVLLTVASLFLFTSLYLLLPTLPLHIKGLGGTDAHVGLAGGVFTLTAVIFRPVVGGLLDRYGRRMFVLGGIALFALVMYSYSLVGVIAVVVSLRIVQGFGWAFATTAVSTAVTDVIPVPRRAEGMGWYGLAMTVAMAIGPSLGLWGLDQYTAPDVFVFAAGLGALALALTGITPMPYHPPQASEAQGLQPTQASQAGQPPQAGRPRQAQAAQPTQAGQPPQPPQPPQATGPRGDNRRLELFDRSLLPIMLGTVFLTVSYGGIVTFLPVYAETIAVNAGTFFFVYAVTLTAVRPLAGRLSDRHGETAVIVPGVFVTMLAVGLLGYAGGLAGVLVSAVLFGIGFGAAQPALQAAMLRLVSRNRMGLANASFFTAFDLGLGFGSIALGWVAQLLGYRALFMISASSVAVALIIFATVVRRLLRTPVAAGGAAGEAGHRQ